jgi:abortive infection bacteriophage resistance protein
MSPPVKIPFTKSPKSFTEQVQILRGHGLVIDDSEQAQFYLSQLNYYRLAAYCLPFEQDHESHRFITGTTFDDLMNLYIFDREFRLLILDAIERIEVSLRTQMAYHLSHNHNTAHPHLRPQIFHNQRAYNYSVQKLTEEVSRSREDFIKHLKNTYEEDLPPIWAVVELMTMGQLSKWFNNIKERSDRQAISRIYGLDEKVMTSFCESISLVRNHAAHHARLWNRSFTKTMILPRRGDEKLINSLLVAQNNDRRLRKLYNTLVITGHLMDVINPGHHWAQRLISLIDSHNIDVAKMGFPSNWKTLPMWAI